MLGLGETNTESLIYFDSGGDTYYSEHEEGYSRKLQFFPRLSVHSSGIKQKVKPASSRHSPVPAPYRSIIKKSWWGWLTG